MTPQRLVSLAMGLALVVGCAEKTASSDGTIAASQETQQALGVVSWSVHDSAVDGIDENGKAIVHFEQGEGSIEGRMGQSVGWIDYGFDENGKLTVMRNDFAEAPAAVEAARLAAHDLEDVNVQPEDVHPQGLHPTDLVKGTGCLVHASDSSGAGAAAGCGVAASCANSIAQANRCQAGLFINHNTQAPSCITYTTDNDWAHALGLARTTITNHCDKSYRVKVDVSRAQDSGCVDVPAGGSRDVAHSNDTGVVGHVHSIVLC